MNRRTLITRLAAGVAVVLGARATATEASGVPFSQEAHEQILADRYADGYLQATQRAESRAALGLPIRLDGYTSWPEPFTGHLPAGTFLMSESPWGEAGLTSNATLIGSGADLTTIKYNPPIPLCAPGAHHSTIRNIRFEPIEPLTFEDMQTDCAMRGCSLTASYIDSHESPRMLTHGDASGIWTGFDYGDMNPDIILARINEWRRSLHGEV